MGLLDWLGFGKRAQQIVPDEGAMLGMQLRVLGGMRPPRRGSKELLAAYAELPWLHAVVRRRAEALAGTPWRLFRAKGGPRGRDRVRSLSRLTHERRQRALTSTEMASQIEEVFDHPLLDLLDKPNGAFTGRALWELTSKHQDLLGESFWGIERRGSRPTELWPIVPTWVTKIPTAANPTYDIQPTGGAFRRITPPQEDVIWIRQHDPLDPYLGRGVGTAGALGDELETDEYMAAMAKSRFFNRSTPEVLVAIEGASDPELDRFAQAWEDKHRGVGKQGQAHFFSRKFQAQQLSHTMVESQYVEGRKLLRDFCLEVFGVPPEILGVLENANRSTIDAAEVLFARYSTVPMLDRFRSELQAWIVPEFGDDLLLDYVSPVPEDRQSQLKVMVALPTAFRVDEVRALAGQRPVGGEKGEAFMVAPGAPRIPVETTPSDVEPDDTDEEPEEKEQSPRALLAGALRLLPPQEADRGLDA